MPGKPWSWPEGHRAETRMEQKDKRRRTERWRAEMTGAERRQTEKPDAGSHKTAEIVLSAFLPLLFYGLAAETALIVLEAVWRMSGIWASAGEAGAAVFLTEVLPQAASGMGAAVIIFWYWPRPGNTRMEQEGGGRFGGPQSKGKWVRAAWKLPAAGVCYCIGMSGLICLAAAALVPAEISESALAQTAVSAAEPAVSRAGGAAAAALTFLCTGFLIPFAEEVLFRGLMYKRLRRRFGVWACALTTAAVFGIYHGNVQQGIYAGLMGLFLAFLTERFHTVTAAASVHIAANLTALTLDAAAFGTWMESGRLSAWGLTLTALAAWAYLICRLYAETKAL